MKFLALSALALVASAKSITLRPLVEPSHAELITGEYIVYLNEPEDSLQAATLVDDHLQSLFGVGIMADHQIMHKYEFGYSAVLNDDTVNHLRHMPSVDFVEVNSVVHTLRVQANPENWGLDRVSHRDLPLKNEYVYSETAGEGVDAYIVDTGVNILHKDFEGRATWGLTAPKGDEDKDGNGHGTHVASTVGGKMYGVAKKVNIIAVKVLRSNGYGTTADVIKGIEFVGLEHRRRSGASGKAVKSVANMSLGGGKSPALDLAVTRSIAKGVLFAVAAGNDDSDACNYSPAATKDALTVGASTKFDTRAYFSNWGKCVDLFAPGYEITAAWIGSTTAARTISGTSMASPHVCGVMALVAASGDYTAQQLKEKVLALSTAGKISDVKGSPNQLLFSAPAETKLPMRFEHDFATVPQSIVEGLRYQF